MKITDWIQVLMTLLVLVIFAPLLGVYFAKVYEGKTHLMSRSLGFIEHALQKVVGARFLKEMQWQSYAWALVAFNLIGFVFVYVVQIMQNSLPLNPQALPNVPWHLALNTAISFVTNTNWQAYGGETTLSNLVQMLALGVQNFLSAATGMAVAVALCRGLSQKTEKTIGNFWIDLIRSTVYILLPLSVVLALVLVAQGVVQSFNPAAHVTTLSGDLQIIPLGPVASQEAIKQLGTNGGGFFNANSAHPFENPSPFSNWLELISILLIPAGFAFLYGRLVGNLKQGRIIFGVMFALLVTGLGLSLWSEFKPNPALSGLVSMEGKETRIGVAGSVLWSTFTTAASNGSVNAMHSSLSPVSGAVALLNMMLGEIIFGGVGSGLYGMLIFVILTVFIAGLMVGRSPEYLGKKIDARDVQMAVLAILLPSACVLLGTAFAILTPSALASLSSHGPHAFSELLYAYTSAANNNGSAFAGLNANTEFFNITLGIAMLVGRFGVILPTLAIAGNFALKKYTKPTSGMFNTNSFIFAGLLIAVILIVGGLTFFPALILGPGLEQMLMNSGKVF